MAVLTVKDKVLAVLYGAAPAIDLSSEDIQYVKENLPAILKAGKPHVETNLDFSSIRFNHKAESFNDALDFDKKQVKSLERKIEDAMEDYEARSMALEALLRDTSIKEIVWLIDCGMDAIIDNKMKDALMQMVGIGKKRNKGNDTKPGSIGTDFTSED